MTIPHDLPALREWWGRAYDINWDFRTQAFRAVRRDTGAVLEDASTEALWDKVWADCEAAPVVVYET